MSEAGPQREQRFHVEDMAACCDKVLACTQGIDRTGFVSGPTR